MDLIDNQGQDAIEVTRANGSMRTRAYWKPLRRPGGRTNGGKIREYGKGHGAQARPFSCLAFDLPAAPVDLGSQCRYSWIRRLRKVRRWKRGNKIRPRT